MLHAFGILIGEGVNTTIRARCCWVDLSNRIHTAVVSTCTTWSCANRRCSYLYVRCYTLASTFIIWLGFSVVVTVVEGL